MPERYRRPFIDGRRAQPVDFTGTVSKSQRSQKRPDLLLKKEFFFLAINENSCRLYELTMKTQSSSQLRPPLKRV
jgi:hypothetical protein